MYVASQLPETHGGYQPTPIMLLLLLVNSSTYSAYASTVVTSMEVFIHGCVVRNQKNKK